MKVSSKPPTYYPSGVPEDHPTDYRSGKWIYLKDTADTRFFIPIHGLLPEKRKALKAEAMAARHKDLTRNVNSEDRALQAKELAGRSAVTIGGAILGIVDGLSQP